MSASEIANLKTFYVLLAKKMKHMVKMSRVGVAVKIIFTLMLGYTDLITDLLVTKSYSEAGGREDMTHAMAGCIALTLFMQGAITFYQVSASEFCSDKLREIS